MTPGLALHHALVGRCALCERRTLFGLCRTCAKGQLQQRTTPAGLRCFALGIYGNVIEAGISRMKFGDEPIWAHHLGSALGSLLPSELTEVTLVPVPLHPLRLAERGYNQSALLARAVARRAGLNVSFDLLRRHKSTKQQARLGAAARTENTRDAFSAPPQTVRDMKKPLVLVDDVVTSGRTLDACASALRRGGHTVAAALCCATAQLQTDASQQRSQKMV